MTTPRKKPFKTRTSLMLNKMAEGKWDYEEHTNCLKIAGKNYLVLNGEVNDFLSQPIVSVGTDPNNREIIVLDPDDLNREYQLFKKKYLTQDKKNDEAILKELMAFVKLKFPKNSVTAVNEIIDGWHPSYSYKGRPVMPLKAFLLFDTGICRHYSLLSAFLLNSLIKDKLITDGTIHHVRNLIRQGSHAWVIYQPHGWNNEAYSIDALHFDVPFKVEADQEKLRSHYGAAIDEVRLRFFDFNFTTNYSFEIQGSTCNYQKIVSTGESKAVGYSHQFQKLLGRGSYGEVSLMTPLDAKSSFPLAVKEFKPNLEYSVNVPNDTITASIILNYERFCREPFFNYDLYQVGSLCSSPSSITISIQGQKKIVTEYPRAWVAMKYIEGIRWSEYKFNDNEVFFQVAIATLKSVRNMHLRFNHNDLHATNILIQETKEEGIKVYPCDFTLSQTKGGIIRGLWDLNLKIKPPEFKNRTEIETDSSIDIWCLGKLFDTTSRTNSLAPAILDITVEMQHTNPEKRLSLNQALFQFIILYSSLQPKSKQIETLFNELAQLDHSDVISLVNSIPRDLLQGFFINIDWVSNPRFNIEFKKILIKKRFEDICNFRENWVSMKGTAFDNWCAAFYYQHLPLENEADCQASAEIINNLLNNTNSSKVKKANELLCQSEKHLRLLDAKLEKLNEDVAKDIVASLDMGGISEFAKIEPPLKNIFNNIQLILKKYCLIKKSKINQEEEFDKWCYYHFFPQTEEAKNISKAYLDNIISGEVKPGDGAKIVKQLVTKLEDLWGILFDLESKQRFNIIQLLGSLFIKLLIHRYEDFITLYERFSEPEQIKFLQTMGLNYLEKFNKKLIHSSSIFNKLERAFGKEVLEKFSHEYLTEQEKQGCMTYGDLNSGNLMHIPEPILIERMFRFVVTTQTAYTKKFPEPLAINCWLLCQRVLSHLKLKDYASAVQDFNCLDERLFHAKHKQIADTIRNELPDFKLLLTLLSQEGLDRKIEIIKHLNSLNPTWLAQFYYPDNLAAIQNLLPAADKKLFFELVVKAKQIELEEREAEHKYPLFSLEQWCGLRALLASPSCSGDEKASSNYGITEYKKFIIKDDLTNLINELKQPFPPRKLILFNLLSQDYLFTLIKKEDDFDKLKAVIPQVEKTNFIFNNLFLNYKQLIYKLFNKYSELSREAKYQKVIQELQYLAASYILKQMLLVLNKVYREERNNDLREQFHLFGSKRSHKLNASLKLEKFILKESSTLDFTPEEEKVANDKTLGLINSALRKL